MPKYTNKSDIPEDMVNALESWKGIANAENDDELQKAIELAITSCRIIFDTSSRKNLQESAKEYWKNPEDKSLQAKFTEKFNQFLYADAVEKGSYLGSKVHPDDREYAERLRSQLVIEHKVSSSTERLIVDMVVANYFRYLRISEIHIRFVSMIHSEDNSTQQTKINLLKQYDKQIEASYRQFMSSITFLKEMRRPKFNIKIQTNETYVAKNQQINKNP